MLVHVYLACACIFSIELFLRLNFLSYVISISRNTKKVSHIIITPKISDHWKEKTVPAYAFVLLKNSLSILGISLPIVLIFFGFTFLSSQFLPFLSSATGIVESIVIAFSYSRLRILLLNE